MTTPDQYPLSLNAVRVACNQTTNREPVVDLTEATVQHALDELRELELVTRNKAAGERAIKFRHRAHEVFDLDRPAQAVVCVLMLRGEQTVGELKQRCERLHGFSSTQDVEVVLDDLARREFVVMLARRPGHKENRWKELLSDTAESAGSGPSAGQRAVPKVPAVATVPIVVATHAQVSKTMSIRNPATGEEIRTVEVADEVEIAAKLKRARSAQPAWAGRSYEQRAATVARWRDQIAEHAETSAQIMTAETGKAIAHSRNELNAVGERIDYYLDHCAGVVEPQKVRIEADLEERITYEPRGVVAHISAWNYPYFVGLNSLVPALLTGNTVLYKPSELATMTGLHIVDLAHRSGIPADVLQCVTGGGATGAALVTSGVDLVGFTGSYPTGRAIAKAAADRLVPVQLELGGKDAAYVCDDVDVDAVAPAVVEGALYHAGQSCCAIERVYVHEHIWEQFLAAFVAAAATWIPGDPLDSATNMGALARAEQPALLAAQVEDAVSKGGRVLLGGQRPDGPGNWFPVTVIVDVDHTAAVMREESFGPIIALMRVADDDAALAHFHDSEFGLTGSIFTRERVRAERFLSRLDVGTVYWNCSDRTTTRLPWAGRRHSGLGVSMGTAGIKAFVHEKSWHARPV